MQFGSFTQQASTGRPSPPQGPCHPEGPGPLGPQVIDALALSFSSHMTLKAMDAAAVKPAPIPIAGGSAGGRGQTRRAPACWAEAAANAGDARAPSPEPAAVGPQEPLFPVDRVQARLQELLQPSHALEEQFYSDCLVACEAVRQGGQYPVAEVALALGALGYEPVAVRRVLNHSEYWSRPTASCFCVASLLLPPPAPAAPAHGQHHHNRQHQHQQATGTAAHQGGTSAPTPQVYVLDPHFKQAFQLAHMSQRYRLVWDCLPTVFVGPPHRLLPVLQLLSYEVLQSFESLGMQVPPWRSFEAHIARWLQREVEDVCVPVRLGPGGLEWCDTQVARFREACARLARPRRERERLQLHPQQPTYYYQGQGTAAAGAGGQNHSQQKQVGSSSGGTCSLGPGSAADVAAGAGSCSGPFSSAGPAAVSGQCAGPRSVLTPAEGPDLGPGSGYGPSSHASSVGPWVTQVGFDCSDAWFDQDGEGYEEEEEEEEGSVAAGPAGARARAGACSPEGQQRRSGRMPRAQVAAAAAAASGQLLGPSPSPSTTTHRRRSSACSVASSSNASSRPVSLLSNSLRGVRGCMAIADAGGWPADVGPLLMCCDMGEEL